MATVVGMKEAKQVAKRYGFTLKNDDGEFRVCLKGKPEATAYYTSDLQDAVDTGIEMAAADLRAFWNTKGRADT